MQLDIRHRHISKHFLMLEMVAYALVSKKKLNVYTHSVDRLYNDLRKSFPDANLVKGKRCVMVNQEVLKCASC